MKPPHVLPINPDGMDDEQLKDLIRRATRAGDFRIPEPVIDQLVAKLRDPALLDEDGNIPAFKVIYDHAQNSYDLVKIQLAPSIEELEKEFYPGIARATAHGTSFGVRLMPLLRNVMHHADATTMEDRIAVVAGAVWGLIHEALVNEYPTIYLPDNPRLVQEFRDRPALAHIMFIQYLASHPAYMVSLAGASGIVDDAVDEKAGVQTRENLLRSRGHSLFTTSEQSASPLSVVIERMSLHGSGGLLGEAVTFTKVISAAALAQGMAAEGIMPNVDESPLETLTKATMLGLMGKATKVPIDPAGMQAYLDAQLEADIKALELCVTLMEAADVEVPGMHRLVTKILQALYLVVGLDPSAELAGPIDSLRRVEKAFEQKRMTGAEKEYIERVQPLLERLHEVSRKHALRAIGISDLAAETQQDTSSSANDALAKFLEGIVDDLDRPSSPEEGK